MNRTIIRKVVVFVLGSYGISWLIWGSGYFIGYRVVNGGFRALLHYGGSFGPFTSGVLTVSLFEKRTGRRAYLNRIFRAPDTMYWYLFPLLVPVVLLFAAAGIKGTILGSSVDYAVLFASPVNIAFPHGPGTKNAIGLAYGALTNLLLWSLTFGIGEEAGWRGFLFTRLSGTGIFGANNPRSAGVVTGLFWAGWHLPLFFFDPSFRDLVGFTMVGWFIGLMSGSLLLSWLTVNAKWSIVPAILWHGAFDTVVSGTDPFVAGFCSMAVVALAVYIWIKYGSKLSTTTPDLRRFCGEITYNRNGSLSDGATDIRETNGNLTGRSSQ